MLGLEEMIDLAQWRDNSEDRRVAFPWQNTRFGEENKQWRALQMTYIEHRGIEQILA